MGNNNKYLPIFVNFHIFIIYFTGKVYGLGVFYNVWRYIKSSKYIIDINNIIFNRKA